MLFLPVLSRLHTAQRAIKQTQVTVQKIGKDIEEKLRTTTACTKRVSQPAKYRSSTDLFSSATHSLANPLSTSCQYHVFMCELQ
jgi:hypothetical protein